MRLCLFLYLFLAPFGLFSQGYVINGNIVDAGTKATIPGGSVKMIYLDSSFGKLVQKRIIDKRTGQEKDTLVFRFKSDSTISDDKGAFSFSNVPGGYYNIYCKISIDSLLISRYYFEERVLVKGNSIFLKLTPEAYCAYDQYRKLDHCPVCMKKDHLRKVVYGLPEYDSRNVKQVLTGKDEYWIGYCTIANECYARWYCNRCKKLF